MAVTTKRFTTSIPAELKNGIISGYGNGELGPGRRATRAQAAQMLKNFFENQ